jgi:flavin-dependent dehydrogenase
LIGGPEIESHYERPVSYGIRRCEFDQYLLDRTGARRCEAEAVEQIERVEGGWLVNGSIRAPLVVGAGGHFCPVARMLGARSIAGSGVVAAQEIEFAAHADELARGTIHPAVPELFFCPDLQGYGWCFRKGDFLNVGLGRRDPRALGRHVAAFVDWLVQRGRIEPPPARGWRGHAYGLRAGRPRRPVGDGVLLAGDAAALAFSASGEGIGPAVVSGRLAAEVLLEGGGEWSEARLEGYARRLEEALGPSPARRALPASVTRLAGAALLPLPWFARCVVLNAWFLHR